MLFIHLLVCFLGHVIVINAQTCYYPDRSVSPHDTPCHSPFTSDGFSACCDRFDLCLDNGLCLAQGGSEIISRGSCTDESWQSPQCSQYCEDGDYLFILFGNRESCYGLILTLILILQSTQAAGRLYNSFISRRSFYSAAARATHTTTHA